MDCAVILQGPPLWSGPVYLSDLPSGLSLPPRGCSSHAGLLWSLEPGKLSSISGALLWLFPLTGTLFPRSLQDSPLLTIHVSGKSHPLTKAFLNSGLAPRHSRPCCSVLFSSWYLLLHESVLSSQSLSTSTLPPTMM